MNHQTPQVTPWDKAKFAPMETPAGTVQLGVMLALVSSDGLKFIPINEFLRPGWTMAWTAHDDGTWTVQWGPQQ